jgi:hypothetical protein
VVGYNVQLVVDTKHHLIFTHAVTNVAPRNMPSPRRRTDSWCRGGNAAGAGLKDYNLGTLGDTIVGALGGIGGGQILTAIRFISYEPALGPLRLPRSGPIPDWLISGGESSGGAPIEPAVDSRHPRRLPPSRCGVEANRADPFGKGGGLIDGELVREFPTPRRLVLRDVAWKRSAMGNHARRILRQLEVHSFLTRPGAWTSINLEGETREPSIPSALDEDAPGGSHEVW